MCHWNINEYCLKGRSIYSSPSVLTLNYLMRKLWKREQIQSSPPTIDDVACGCAASTILSVQGRKLIPLYRLQILTSAQRCCCYHYLVFTPLPRNLNASSLQITGCDWGLKNAQNNPKRLISIRVYSGQTTLSPPMLQMWHHVCLGFFCWNEYKIPAYQSSALEKIVDSHYISFLQWNC